MHKLDLPRFEEALRENPDAAKALGRMSYRRYLDGEFPAAIRWLMRFPTVGRALMDDAEAITAETSSISSSRTRSVRREGQPAPARSRQRTAS
jgi:hypothetical protein